MDLRTLLLLASLTTGYAGSAVSVRPGVAIGHEDPAIRQALELLRQQVAPVEVIDFARARRLYAQTPGARPLTAEFADGLHAFRLVGGDRIFVNRGSTIYAEAARTPSPLRLLKLAALLVHEQVHATDGEYAATRLQADFVRERVKALPRRERADGAMYLRDLEGRATALGRGLRKTAVRSGKG